MAAEFVVQKMIRVPLSLAQAMEAARRAAEMNEAQFVRLALANQVKRVQLREARASRSSKREAAPTAERAG